MIELVLKWAAITCGSLILTLLVVAVLAYFALRTPPSDPVDDYLNEERDVWRDAPDGDVRRGSGKGGLIDASKRAGEDDERD